MQTGQAREVILSEAARKYPRFAAEAAAEKPDLLTLCALVCEGLCPLDLERIDRQIGFLAYLVGAACADDSPAERASALRRVLANEEGYVAAGEGDAVETDDPKHTLLPAVLEHRHGLPISLSVLYLAVARRLGWPVEGLDFPTRFLLRFVDTPELVVIDPFDGGATLSGDDCSQLLRPAFGRLPEPAFERFRDMRLAAIASPRIIAARLLKHLEGSYLRRQMFDEVRVVIEKLLLLDQAAIAELRDLGEIHHMLGENQRALTCLRLYLDEAPYAADRVLVQRVVRQIERQVDGV